MERSLGDECRDIGVKNTENIKACLLQGQDYQSFTVRWRNDGVQVEDVAGISPGLDSKRSTALTEWLGFSPRDTLHRSGLLLPMKRFVDRLVL